MSNSRTKNATLNIIFALILQAVTFFRGLILPRIIIPTYGSDVNGLLSSISQFLAYISLLEAGVGSIFRSTLYKPLANGNMDEVSGIINEQKRFYKKIGIAFAFYVVVLCFIYPLVAKTEIGKGYIVTCILILSVSTFAEYFFSLPYTSLLSADQKLRISYIVSIIYVIVNIFVSLFWVWMKADIRMIYLSMSIIGLLRPLFYTLYVKKHYNLNKNAPCNKSALDQRWNGMVHHFAYYIHTNTDSAILTLFISTAAVSVYNVYGAIVFGVQSIIVSISNGIAAGLGNLLAVGDKKQIDQTVNLYEFVQGSVTTVVYSVTALLLVPFIRIYTADMTDANYIQPIFGYVLIAAEAIYCFRCIYSTVSTTANKFRETQVGAILECSVNLITSILLVTVAKLGILGVAIGTAIGMFSRYAFEVRFLSKNVLNRPVAKAAKMMLVSLLTASLSIALCRFIFNYGNISNLGIWLIYAVMTGAVTAIVSTAIYTIFYADIIKILLKKFFRKG